MGKVLFYTCRKFENNIFFVKIFYEKIKFPIRKKEKKKNTRSRILSRILEKNNHIQSAKINLYKLRKI